MGSRKKLKECLRWHIKYGKVPEGQKKNLMEVLESAEYGDNEVQAALAAKELDNMPLLFSGLLPYWNAFWELSGSRSMGFGMGSIPYSEITGWLDENGVDHWQDRRDYREIIRFIDRAYLDITAEQREKDKPKK